MIIAIDGPAGTGNSTIASLLAKKLNMTFLNSGGFYRALTIALLDNNMIDKTDSEKIAFCKNQKLGFKNSHIMLNETDVEHRLHDDKVSSQVASLSAIPEIRHIVNDVMREITKALDIVCEGRDMTTVVFPNAEHKFYLDASLEVQAERRFKQGVSNLSLEEIKDAIKKRDEIDKNKKEGALKIAKDAHYIDTSTLTIEQVCAIILNKISRKGPIMENQEVENELKSDSDGKFEAQLEETLKNMNTAEDGQLVTGKIVAVTGDTVFVDVNCKSEGRIPREEFGSDEPKVGDEVEVRLIQQFGRNGPVISKRQADEKRLWKSIQASFKEKAPIQGKISKVVKGGYEVDLGGGIHAFLPVSQSDTQKVEKVETLLGVSSNFYIERLYSEGKQNVVVNRRRYMEEQSSKAREEFFSNVTIGDTVKGTVKSFTSFGAFIDLGGFDGLLHINDMSWGHVARPKDFVKRGQEVELKVIRMDAAEKRINLSLKHFSEDPWMHFEDKYRVNDIVTGKVTKLTDFGAFIELEEGIEGLVHISEFSWTKKISKPSELLKIGDEVKCMILGYDIQGGKVSLGLKQTTENPWDTIGDKYPIGQKVKGKVVKVTNAGAFVELEDGIDGFLHADDLSWTKKVKYIGSEIQQDQEIEAVVIANDAENHRIKLGIKQLTDNPWTAFAEEHKPGTTLEGEITSITDFGVFVKAAEGIEGLVNKANLSENKETPFEEAVKNYKVGDKLTVYVIDVNVEKEKVAFSVRELKRAQERAVISQYMSKSNDDGAYTFGDFLQTQKQD
ncbi:MAG: 30S ribosomal protein S1 [Treponema sp.]|nr:30S ribosomal protein S1 [Treponema sp.]